MFSILNNEDGLAKKDVQHKVSLFCKSWIWEGSFHVVNLAYTICHICCLSWWPHRSATTECWPLCVLVQLSMLSCSDTVKILWKHASLKMSWSEKWQMPLHSIFFLWLTRITGSVFLFQCIVLHFWLEQLKSSLFLLISSLSRQSVMVDLKRSNWT